MGQLCPELLVELFLEEWEWKVLYCAEGKTKEVLQKEYIIKDAV